MWMWEELVHHRLIGGWLPASYQFCMHCKAARSMEWSQWTARLKQMTQALEDLELSYRVDEVVAYSRWVTMATRQES